MNVLLRVSVLLEAYRQRLLVLLLTGVVVSGALYSIALGNSLRYPDEQEYFTISGSLSQSYRYSLDGRTPTTARAPFYPFVLAVLGFFNAQPAHFRMLNFVALAATAVVLYRLVTSQTSPTGGLIAVMLLVCYPVLFYTAGTLYPQTIGSLLFVLSIWLLIRSIKSQSLPYAAGLVFGCLMLTIPAFSLTLACLVVICSLIDLTGSPARPTNASVRANQRRVALIFAFVALVPVLMWSGRNYLVTGRFVFISSNAGLNLLLGNSENTTANTGVNVDISRYQNEASSMDEVDRDSFYRSKAIDWIKNNNATAFRLYVLKSLNYFNYRNRLFVQSESSSLKDMLMFVTYYSILFAVAARLFLVRYFELSGLERLLILLYVSNAFVSAIFFTRIRFRLPYDLLLIGVVAIFLEQVRSRFLHLEYAPSVKRSWGRS